MIPNGAPVTMIQTAQTMMGAPTHGVSVLPKSPKVPTPTNQFARSEATFQRISAFSNLANQAIEQGKYRQALDCYQSALEDYLDGSPSLVETVNAAATCFNLGALSKKLQEYRQAADYFCQAEDLYRACADKVKEVQHTPGTEQQSASTCDVCLKQLIVETLQARAHLHYKYQKWLDDAIECHELVIEVLEANNTSDDEAVDYNKIHFTVLPDSTLRELLVASLQSLGKFYIERGELEDGLMAYQETLKVLKEQHEMDGSTQQRQDEISQIIRALSEIYLRTNSSQMRTPQLQKLALLQEDLEHWEKALNLWEQVLFLQSQEFGEESVEVASTLCQIARVMIIEGNHEGGLDLYHAAIAKHLTSLAPVPKGLISNVAQAYCQMGQHSDAIAWLQDLLEQTHTREESACIHYELGKIYLEQGDLLQASEALCRSTEICESNDEHVFKLLQRVEFLQQRVELAGVDRGLSSIIEDDECSATVNDDSILEEKKSGDDHDQLESLRKSQSREEQPEDLASTPMLELGMKGCSVSPEGPADETDEIIRCDLNVSEQSSALILADTTDCTAQDDSSTKDVPATSDDEASRSLSPVPDNGLEKLVLSTPALDLAPFGNESGEMPRIVTPGALLTISGPFSADRDNAENSPQLGPFSEERDSAVTYPQENVSKATDTTEQSLETSPDISPKSRDESDGQNVDSREQRATATLEDSSEFVDCLTHRVESSDDAESSSFQEGERISDLPRMEPTDEVRIEPSDVPHHQIGAAAIDESKKRSQAVDSAPLPTPVSISSSSPSPAVSETSRTGLLQHLEKSPSNAKGIRIPTLSSPRHSKLRERREYSEVNPAPKASSRHRLVKALSSPFRRSRAKRQSSELHALNEEAEVKQSLVIDTAHAKTDDAGVLEVDRNAPVSFISLQNRGGDDDEQSQVSQITFKMEEATPKRSQQDSQWWWGVTAEGLEGWFPTSYVNQAVEAAEGFLSARSIHERVKSRPLDFDSDEESEGGEETSLANHKKSSLSPASEDKAPLAKPPVVKNQSRKNSMNSTGPRLSIAGSVGAVATSQSEGSKHQSLNLQIQEKLDIIDRAEAEEGPSNSSVSSALFDLAVLYCRQGDTSRAIESAERAVKIQKSTLRLSEACKTLHFMADLQSRQNQYHSALSCYSEAQRLQEAVFGYFHEETANTLNRIGNVLARKGEFDLAMENHKEALRILKVCCGEEIKNPLVSQTLIQIGAVYYKERNSLATIQSKVDGYTTFIEGGMLEVIGRAHEERGSYRMAIAFFEEKLQFLNDKKHSNDLDQVSETLNSLGMLSCRAGMYLEAIDYYDRALAIQMELGCDDIQLSMARVLAGSVQYALGHFNKAMKLFEDAIATLRQEIGTEQETIAATLFHMGVVRVALCDYDRAMSDLKEAFTMQKKLLGNEHPATLRTRREMANMYAVYVTEVDSAFAEYRSILEVQKRIHGERHPNVAETMHSIGCAHARAGDFSTALKTLEDCYNMRLEFLGSDHPLQATTLHEIAKIQLKRGRIKKALHICESSLNIRIDALSEQHVDVGTTMATKASCLVARGSFNEASKIFTESLKITEAAVGSSHPTVAAIHGQIGIMHLRKCHFEEASEEIRKALEIYRRSNLDEDHPGIKEALQDLERVERAEMLCV